MEVILLHIERRQSRRFEYLTRTPPGCLIFVPGMPCREDALGQNQDMLERLHVSAVLGTLQCTPEEVEEVAGRQRSGHSHLGCCMTRSQTTGRRWMDGLVK